MNYLQVVQVFSSIPRWSVFGRRQHTLHHCLLLTNCPHCKQRLYTGSAILRHDSKSVFIPNVGYCKECGQPLFEDNKNFIEVKNPMHSRLTFEPPEINPTDSESFSNWFGISRIKDTHWRQYFGLPLEVDPLFKPRTIGLKHYRKLFKSARRKVAKAVGIYRAEKHRRRAEKRLAAEVAESAK